MDYERELEKLIRLLEKASEDHWVRYFNEALDKHRSGTIGASYKHVLGAYGGMGSFSDIFLNFITEEEVAEVEGIRSRLWSYCRDKRRLS